MTIDLDIVSGSIDAETVDENFEKLENFLKENVSKEDFNEKFDKYKIRRYTSGKISAFNTGTNPYSSPRSAVVTGTFENNWNEGSDVPTFRVHSDKALHKGAKDAAVGGRRNGEVSDGLNAGRYSLNSRPKELLGFPGGDLTYDFQEQGIPHLDQVHGEDISNYPPRGPLQASPDNECWSMWLTVPDAAGAVYVDEPCVALITATVRGNYFFTPALRTVCQDQTDDITIERSLVPVTPGGAVPPDEDYSNNFDYKYCRDHSGLYAIKEGQDQSAFLRLGLFVDTNPIVHDDEFYNGDDYGRETGFGHNYNPWIGTNAKGDLETVRPSGVAKTRSWIKVREVTYRVRQRGTYTITAAVELKGRKKYNFSLKFRPAGYYGYVEKLTPSIAFNKEFVEGIAELAHQDKYDDEGVKTDASRFSVIHDNYHNYAGKTMYFGNSHNPSWMWGIDPLYHFCYAIGIADSVVEPGFGPSTGDSSAAVFKRPWNQNWLWPGADSLVTNFIESSSLGVEFFYGQSEVTYVAPDGIPILHDNNPQEDPVKDDEDISIPKSDFGDNNIG